MTKAAQEAEAAEAGAAEAGASTLHEQLSANMEMDQRWRQRHGGPTLLSDKGGPEQVLEEPVEGASTSGGGRGQAVAAAVTGRAAGAGHGGAGGHGCTGVERSAGAVVGKGCATDVVGKGCAADGPRVCVDEVKGAVVFQRYYHLFQRGELEGLVAGLAGARLLEAYYDRSNWCVVMERL